MKIAALIPLRGETGGTRMGFPKEITDLGKHPLLAYTIRWAIKSKIFNDVLTITPSRLALGMATKYGASNCLGLLPWVPSKQALDIDYVNWFLEETQNEFQIYSILRVTSPFRTDVDIRTAKNLFVNASAADSLRTVTKSPKDPFKMWTIRNNRLLPLFSFGPEKQPFHSRASQLNPQIYIQTAGMEMAWTNMTKRTGTIAGTNIIPYVVDDFASLDINTREDWSEAEMLLKSKKVLIPEELE